MNAVLTMPNMASSDPGNQMREMDASTLRRRIEWMDSARGIGIILVVYGHVLRGLLDAGYLSKASPLWLSDYSIYTFHMPFFFLLAGLNVRRSIEKGKATFILGKLWTVAYPYFLWSTIQGTIQLQISRLALSVLNHKPSPLFMEVILRHPISQFWFLYALFICHVVAFVVGRSKWTLALVGASSFILSLFSIGEPTSYMLPFYILGILLASYAERWSPSLRTSVIVGVTGVVLFAVAVKLGHAASHGKAASVFSMPAALLGIGLLCLLGQLLACMSRPLTQILKAIGAMSMTIYILHIMADTAARFVLKWLGIDNIADQLLFGVIAGVGLPMIAHVTFDRLNLLTPLGLASWKRPVGADIEYRPSILQKIVGV